MSKNAESFDAWIRSAFVDMNTELEELYFGRENRSEVAGVGDDMIRLSVGLEDVADITDDLAGALRASQRA